jgi:hypothetical protein
MVIRLCQFHIIKAILTWIKNKKNNKHGLTSEVVPQLLNLFRAAQRCRTASQWPQFLLQFEEGIQELEDKYDCNGEVICRYFRENWWCPEWLGECLPN